MAPTAAEARASDLAARLGLRRVAQNRYRGPCVLCGHRTLEIRDGDRAVLVTCWHGCDRQAILAEFRRRGLLPDREQPFDGEAWRREQEQRRQAEGFRRVGEIMVERALETLPASDPARRDLTELQARLRLDPDAEMAWWRTYRPELAAAMLEAWRRHEKRLRRRAWEWVRVLEGE
jgi:hypothetical protein